MGLRAFHQKNIKNYGVEEVDITLLRIFKKDPRSSYIAYKYLDDIRLNLMKVYKALKKGTRYVVINNKIRGELFKNWKYIIELAKIIDFKVENYFASENIKHFIIHITKQYIFIYNDKIVK